MHVGQIAEPVVEDAAQADHRARAARRRSDGDVGVVDDGHVVALVAAAPDRPGVKPHAVDPARAQPGVADERRPLAGRHRDAAVAWPLVVTLRDDVRPEADRELVPRRVAVEHGAAEAHRQTQPRLRQEPGPAMTERGFVQRRHRCEQQRASAARHARPALREVAPQPVRRLADDGARRRRHDEVVQRRVLGDLDEVLPERRREDRRHEGPGRAQPVAPRDLVVGGPVERVADGVRVEVVAVERDLVGGEQLAAPAGPLHGAAPALVAAVAQVPDGARADTQRGLEQRVKVGVRDDRLVQPVVERLDRLDRLDRDRHRGRGRGAVPGPENRDECERCQQRAILTTVS